MITVIAKDVLEKIFLMTQDNIVNIFSVCQIFYNVIENSEKLKICLHDQQEKMTQDFIYVYRKTMKNMGYVSQRQIKTDVNTVFDKIDYDQLPVFKWTQHNKYAFLINDITPSISRKKKIVLKSNEKIQISKLVDDSNFSTGIRKMSVAALDKKYANTLSIKIYIGGTLCDTLYDGLAKHLPKKLIHPFIPIGRHIALYQKIFIESNYDCLIGMDLVYLNSDLEESLASPQNLLWSYCCNKPNRNCNNKLCQIYIPKEECVKKSFLKDTEKINLCHSNYKCLFNLFENVPVNQTVLMTGQGMMSLLKDHNFTCKNNF